MRDFMRENGWKYVPGTILLIANCYFQMLVPRFIGNMIDVLSVGTIDWNALNRLLMLFIGNAFLIFLLRFSWRSILIGNARKLERHARRRLFTHLQQMSVHFYNHQKTGDLMAYAVNDINAIRMTFGMGISMGLFSLGMSAFTIGSMTSTINLGLALYSLIPIPIIIVLVLVMGGQIRVRFKRVQEAFASVSDRVQENISGIRVIKAYVQESSEVERFQELNERSKKANMDMVRISASMNPIVTMLFGLCFAINLVYGSQLVRDGVITVGELVTFNGYLALIVRPIQSIARVLNVWQRGMASLKRYNAIMDVPPMITSGEGDVPANLPKGEIEVRDLTFIYPQTSRKVLENVSFHIKPGHTLGILGRTGSGKSTLVNLLVKLYNVPDGKILIDGEDINKFSLDQLRDGIGFVMQDNFLFSTSIEDNIRFFCDDYSEGQVLVAAELAMIHDNIMEFPERYKTEVGERGMSLSGGQKQRICLARALIRKPDILILDDALSAVDTRTEEGILANLNEQKKRGGSAIIIAHRVSALMACDEIIVLDGGRIVERGDHAGLMAQGGFYAQIAQQQASAEQEEGEE